MKIEQARENLACKLLDIGLGRKGAQDELHEFQFKGHFQSKEISPLGPLELLVRINMPRIGDLQIFQMDCRYVQC